MEKFSRVLHDYNYEVSPELIAQKPASPRDSAKLLIFHKKTGKVNYDIFRNIIKYLPPKAVLVFNQTKVIPARLEVTKQITGGKARILYLETIGDKIKVMTDRFLPIGIKVFVDQKLFFTVEGQQEKYYFLKPSFPLKNIYNVLEKYGKTPIPPYIKNSPLSENQLRKEYQAIFAKTKGSVAAPTASLHFTKQLLKKIKKAGIDIKFSTLHVGLGTFAPLTEENIESGKLHNEYYEIDKKTAGFLNKAKKQGRPVIAVGTTVVRTLESSVSGNSLKRLSGGTDLFIKDGYKFGFIDGIITNFHVPQSSLLMLISAFMGFRPKSLSLGRTSGQAKKYSGRKKLLELYKKAAAKKFRFFSFGDGMLIY
ncbi:MAG: tRNA preQ1(34) S-adenosylmethionine ribosyltransferase-isomerase QueA [Candidatus Pacebacteria bacterium]|nr:tRNA preQ1(34) S-adenosylmethionine ribosyltransferase-isomerase QueA [Candidatus Paceibacterota bacterium]